MVTMAKMPLDSFLPSGAILEPDENLLSYAGLVSGQTSSVISALALPHAATQLPHLDNTGLHVQPSLTYMHTAAGTGAAQTQPHQQRYLSPPRSPPGVRDSRSSSPSPAGHHLQYGPVTRSGLVSPSLTPTSSPPLTLSPEQTIIQLRRVTLQNRRLVENWEAERAYLEANRARAEEIYKEERAIMDEERLMWAAREAELQAKIAELENANQVLRTQKEAELASRIAQLEMENAQLRSRNTRDSAIAGIHGRSSASSADDMSPRRGMAPTVTVRTASQGLPTGRGQSMPESNPYIPLDPRMQGNPPAATSTSSASKERVPCVDGASIDPNLDGIHLKASAVKKATFQYDGPALSPQSTSPKTSPPASKKDSPDNHSQASPADLTKQVLSAAPSDRLTMHAGHTPNLSLSTLSTVVSSKVSTKAPNTATSSGSSTPTHPTTQDPLAQEASNEAEADAQGDDLIHEESNAEDAPARFHPSEDPALKGMLSIVNIPAKDEIFLQGVNEKLQQDLEDGTATPRALMNSPMGSETESEQGPARPNQSEAANPVPNVDGPGDDRSKADDDEEDDDDVKPIRFKPTSNFGAPFGKMSRF